MRRLNTRISIRNLLTGAEIDLPDFYDDAGVCLSKALRVFIGIVYAVVPTPNLLRFIVSSPSPTRSI